MAKQQKTPAPARAASNKPKPKKKPPARKKDYTPAVWDMQPKETSSAFEAFTVYREMKYIDRKPGSPTGRSLTRVAEKLGMGHSKVMQMSARNKWVDRCKEYDAYMDKVFGQPEVIEHLEDLRDEQLRACHKMRQLGITMIDRLGEAIEEGVLGPKDYLYVMKHLIRDSAEIELMITKQTEDQPGLVINNTNMANAGEEITTPILIIPDNGRST